MPELTTLRLQFNKPISDREIHMFRAAVIEKTERASSLYHNHQGENNFLYRYPSIQYKICNGLPTILCILDGVDEIHQLLSKEDLKMNIGGRSIDFKIRNFQMREESVEVTSGLEHYELRKWMALNQKNKNRWEELEGNEKARLELLESVLVGNLLSFSKGIDYRIKEKIHLKITKLDKPYQKTFKGRKIYVFDVEFVANLKLPNWIGLGKGSSVGFGIVKLK